MLNKSIARCRIVPIVRGLCSRPLRKYSTPGRVCVRVRQLRPVRRSSLVEGRWFECLSGRLSFNMQVMQVRPSCTTVISAKLQSVEVSSLRRFGERNM
jgi:hypothetical protein